MCANFQAKLTTLTFSSQIFRKINFWNFKYLSADSRSTPLRENVCKFSVKINEFEFFDLMVKLGKFPNYVQYFGSNNIEDVAKS